MSSTTLTRIFIYSLVAVAGIAILWSIFNSESQATDLPISTVAAQIVEGSVKQLNVSSDGREVIVTYKQPGKQQARSQVTGVSSLEEVLAAYGVSGRTYLDQGVAVVYEKPSPWSGFLGLLTFILPILLIVALFYFFMRQSQGANNQAMAFGKSRARMLTSDKPTVTFDDVAGAQEAKEELEEIVAFLREPEKFVNFGARIPKGVLMIGPPGTGKTLMA